MMEKKRRRNGSPRRIALRSLLIIAVAISAVAATSHAQLIASNFCSSSSGINLEICQVWLGDLPIVLVAVLLSFSIAAFLFIIGVAVKDERIKNFGIGELYEAMATALIVGLFFFLAGLLINAIPTAFISYAGAPGSAPVYGPYGVALASISQTENTIYSEYDYIFNDVPLDSVYPGAVCFNFGGQSFDNCAGYKNIMTMLSYNGSVDVLGLLDTGLLYGLKNAALIPYELNAVTPLTIVASYLIDGMYVLWAVYYLIVYFSFISPIFVSVGVVMRALFPTRGFGGMLIAVGMGFYVVAPTLFALLYSANPGTILNICSASSPVGTGACMANFQAVEMFVNSLWLPMVFYPILVIAITYAFITQVANFLGAATQMGGRIRAGFI